MALKDEWQRQQQQRQQEVAQRQQQVYETLIAAQHDRHYKASQLRDDLNLFRESLTENEKVRSLKVQQFQSALQQSRLQRQIETQSFLAAISDRRHTQAQTLALQLNEFVQDLQQRTANFLTLVANDRVAMAQQLTQDLQAFQAELTATVAALRQQLQIDIDDLKLNTQCLLAAHQQHRLQEHIKLTKELVAFTETLRQDVQIYLLEVETDRHVRADRLNKMLTQSREDRQVEVQKLFDRFAVFREELRQFHSRLKHTVWGEGTSSAPDLHSTNNSIKPAIKSEPEKIILKSLAVIPLSDAQIPPVTAQSTQPSSSNGKPVAIAPIKPTKPSKATQKEGTNYEKEVYNYLHASQGGRLSEIESALKINRFQAVDALQSLIKKGLVTQKNRVYLVREDFAQN